MSDKPSAAWYLAPIFLGIIGSAIMWYVLKDEDHPDSSKMVRKGWVIGIVLTLISIVWIPFVFIAVEQQQMQQQIQQQTQQQMQQQIQHQAQQQGNFVISLGIAIIAGGIGAAFLIQKYDADKKKS